MAEPLPGWLSFNLNVVQCRDSLARMASLEPAIVGVGHGDPITRGGADVVRAVAEKL